MSESLVFSQIEPISISDPTRPSGPDGLDFKDSNDVKLSEYPSSFFNRTPLLKPKIITSYVNTTTLDKLATNVMSKVHTSDLDVKLVVQFLVEFGKTLSSTSTEEWTSFGIVICSAGGSVDPTSLLDLEYRDAELSGMDGSNLDTNKVKWLVFYCLMIYRMSRISNYQNKKAIIERAKRVQTVYDSAEIRYHILASLHPTFYTDPDYLKIVAAYDMFFHKFFRHVDVRLKFGSIGTRFRNCDVLESYWKIYKLKGFCDARETLSWVFDEKVKEDFERIFESGQESGLPFSYFPYQVDFGIVTRSKYSSSANPYLHTWLHTIGCFMHHERSFNSRAFNLDNFQNLAYDAFLMFLAQSTRFCQLFSLEPVPPPIERPVQADGSPNSHDPILWSSYGAKNKNKIFKKMGQRLELMKRIFIACRGKTIGRALIESVPVWVKQFDEAKQKIENSETAEN